MFALARTEGATHGAAVTDFDSLETFGGFLDTYLGGGFQRSDQLISRILDCDSPRVYFSTTIRQGDD
jgi:hypothetical protein